MRISIGDNWHVTFPCEDPAPVVLPHRWEDDPVRAAYSGAATYHVDVELPSVHGAILDVGPSHALVEGASAQRRAAGPSYRAAVRAPVGEVAVVRMNGVELRCAVGASVPARCE